jgi:hypothetical protein
MSPLVAAAQATKPTTAPAVLPAPPPPPPKAVAAAYAAALDKGDVPAAAALLPGGEPANAKWVEANVALIGALRKLDAAAVAKFGDAGKVVSQNQLHLTDSFKSLEQAQEKIEGDAATLTVPNQPQPLRLNKVDGKWLLAVAPNGAAEARQRTLYRRLAAAATRTADEITAGKHPTAESAANAFSVRVLEARLTD